MVTDPGQRGVVLSLLRCTLGVALLSASVAGAGELPPVEVFIGGRQVAPEVVKGTINLKRGESHIFHGGMRSGADDRADDGAIATLVGRELLVRAAGERGIKITGKEIHDYAEGRSRILGGKEKFMRYLESAGVPWDVYVKIAGDSLLASRYVEKMIVTEIRVGEEEIRDYHRQNSYLYGEPSIKTSDHLIVSMKGDGPSTELESLFPPAGIPFSPSRTLQGYRKLAEGATAGKADVIRADGIKVKESVRNAMWKQLDEVDPGEGILLKYLENGRMVYQCIFVVGLEEGKKVSLQEATPSIRTKIQAMKKNKAILDEIEGLKKRYPVDVRRPPA